MKGQRLHGSPAWRVHIWGILTWAVINAGLWFCFVWWLLGKTHVVWIIGASAYGGVILVHGLLSSRFGFVFSRSLSASESEIYRVHGTDVASFAFEKKKEFESCSML